MTTDNNNNNHDESEVEDDRPRRKQRRASAPPPLPPLRVFQITSRKPYVRHDGSIGEMVAVEHVTGHFTQFIQASTVAVFEYTRMFDSPYTIIHQMRRAIANYVDVCEVSAAPTTTVQ